MTYELTVNRFGITVPTHVTPDGLTISTPNYVTLSLSARKLLSEQTRSVVADQMKQMGTDVSLQTFGQLVTTETAREPVLTPLETSMGMDLQNIRDTIWSRNGVKDSWLCKLQSLLGIEVVTREMLEQTHQAWLNHIFNEEPKTSGSKTTSKTTKTTARRTPRKKKETTSPGS